MQIQDWYNETTITVDSELDHFDDFGEHPQFVSWSYGSSYDTIYVKYSDGTEISHSVDV